MKLNVTVRLASDGDIVAITEIYSYWDQGGSSVTSAYQNL